MTRRSQRSTFGEWLDITLSNRRMTNRMLADEIGVSDATVSRWRSGLSAPANMDAIADIARILDLDALRLAVTAGIISARVAHVEAYPTPEPTAQRESVRRQIARIKGLSDEGRRKLMDTYDALVNTESEE